MTTPESRGTGMEDYMNQTVSEYSRGEEIANSITHAIAAGMSIAVVVKSFRRSAVELVISGAFLLRPAGLSLNGLIGHAIS